MHAFAPRVREIILENTKTENACGVLLSNGVDSNALVAALLAHGSKPYVFSFRIENRISTDWSHARKVANKLGLEFIDVELSTDVDKIMEQVRFAVHTLGETSKSQIEVNIPLTAVVDRAKEMGLADLYTGLGADGHFGLSLKAAKVCNTDNNANKSAWLDEFRETAFANPKVATLRKYGSRFGITVHSPFVDRRLVDLFNGSTWNNLNRPKQKMPIRDAFPEISAWGVGKHTNLQLGDSGIATNYEQLVKSDYNRRGYKSVVGIYNAVVRGEL
jgi:asparagine synthetase B (glutamine-hydrolysing)